MPYIHTLVSDHSFIVNQTLRELEDWIEKHEIMHTYPHKNYSQFIEAAPPCRPLYQRLIVESSMLALSLIKTIYLLAVTLFYEISQGRTSRVSKAYVSYTLRSLTEAIGHIVSLFHAQRGAYLVEVARFHQDCYQHALSKKR